jgi:hypothetical protein
MRWLVGGTVLLVPVWLGAATWWWQRDSKPQEPARKAERPANRLAKESSPYLRMHGHNPVDWYPWGAEALQRAARENKPIFLSIGYSSCYWCHVMERESFENPEIARLLNESFVSIKVDREERPDLDEIYITAVQLVAGHAGWPLSVFLLPDGRPFFGGTYFPPHDRQGRTGFSTLLQRVSAAWRERRSDIERSADALADALQSAMQARRGLTLKPLGRTLIGDAIEQLADSFDAQHGGFGYDPSNPRRPKFPEPSNLQLLLYHCRSTPQPKAAEMLELTLDRLARGGIWDHVGGGFHRYSTDRYWAIPHFEKMLYDNAQLASVYIESFERTGDAEHRRVAEAIFEFIRRELTSPEGGFHSALDAESEHEEGKYYVWTRDEIAGLLTLEQFKLFEPVYGLDRPANFEGRYTLLMPEPVADQAARLGCSVKELHERLAPLRARLLAARQRRPRPLLDTKVLTAWNGLMIGALADGHRVFGTPQYRAAAEQAAEFVLAKLRAPDGRLLRTYNDGQAKLPAYLEDYAFLAAGLLRLHRATGTERWLDESRRLADAMLAHFWDAERGGFYFTAADHERLLVRVKSARDGVLPSGNSVAVRVLLAIAQHTKQPPYATRAAETLTAFADSLASSPLEHVHMLMGLGEYLDTGLPVGELATAPRPAPKQPEVLRGSVLLSHDRLRVGQPFRIAVRLELSDGWHINANPATRPELVPSTLTMQSDLPLEMLVIEYPRAEPLRAGGLDEPIGVLRGKPVVRARATLGSRATPGKAMLSLRLKYQACDDQRCLAPREIEWRVPVEVVAGDAPVQEINSELFRAP